MERAIRESRYTVAIVSERYLQSGHCEEEAIVTSVLDMADRQRRLIPFVIQQVEMPAWLFGIVGIDCTKHGRAGRSDREAQGHARPPVARRVSGAAQWLPTVSRTFLARRSSLLIVSARELPRRRRRRGRSRRSALAGGAPRARRPMRPRTPCPPSSWRPSRAPTFVEFDLQLTKDRRVVCLHDTSLERTTDVEAVFPDRARTAASAAARTWMLEDFTLDEIKRLDAGAWFDAKYRGTRIPTFGETIDVAARHAAACSSRSRRPERYEGIERLIMAELKARGLDRPGADARTPVLIQSFSADSLKIFKDTLQTTLPIHFLFGATRRGELGDGRRAARHQGVLDRHQPGKGHRRRASGGDGARPEDGSADHAVHVPRERGGGRATRTCAPRCSTTCGR